MARDTLETQGAPDILRTVKVLGRPKDSKGFQKNPKKYERIQKIPNNSKKFKRISKDFKRIRRNSEELTELKRTHRSSIEIHRITPFIQKSQFLFPSFPKSKS